MRRLVIDETVRHALALYKMGDQLGFRSQIDLLKSILASMHATIKPGEVPHKGKLDEIHHIKICIEHLKTLL